jgi:hypothetical protein
MMFLPKHGVEGARCTLVRLEGQWESLDAERVAFRGALPFGPRFRLRRNHVCGVFPPFGFNR